MIYNLIIINNACTRASDENLSKPGHEIDAVNAMSH